MEGSFDQPPVIIRGARTRGIWLTAGSAVFVTVGAATGFTDGRLDPGSIVAVVFFGLCGAMGLAIAIVPPRLEIGPEGITQKMLWRTSRFAWTDVYNFRPAVIGLTNKAVGFDFLTPQSKLRKFNAAFAGVHARLQPGLGADPSSLAALLNQARERWLDTAVTAPISEGQIASAQPAVGFAGARMNRKAYWIVMGAVFVGAIGLSFLPGVLAVVGRGLTWPLMWVFANRLHDTGRSGWWQLSLYAVQLPAIVIVGSAGGPAMAVGLLVQLVFVVILGAIPGSSGDNRFGPPPSRASPAAQAETFR